MDPEVWWGATPPASWWRRTWWRLTARWRWRGWQDLGYTTDETGEDD